MARGSPARIVRPTAPARTPVQLSLEAALRASVSRNTQSSCAGTQLMPATSPKWVTWADMAPANANESAPSRLGRLARRRARRKKNMPSPAAAQVRIMLSVHAAVPGKMANRNVSGYAAPAFQSPIKGAPVQMYGSYSGSWPFLIWCPASTRSGKFCVRSSPGRTGCPSSAGTPKTMTGSATRRTTAAASPGQRLDARVPSTRDVLIPSVGDSSSPTGTLLQQKPERSWEGSFTDPPESPQLPRRAAGPELAKSHSDSSQRRPAGLFPPYIWRYTSPRGEVILDHPPCRIWQSAAPSPLSAAVGGFPASRHRACPARGTCRAGPGWCLSGHLAMAPGAGGQMVTLVQLPAVAGLVMTGLVFVPPNRATSGVPYWASWPNARLVTPGRTLPKFQTQAPPGAPVPARRWVLLRLQN